jgi:transposase
VGYPDVEALPLFASNCKGAWGKHMQSYSTDVRRQLVQAYERRLGSQRALANAFGVSPSFVKKVLRRYRTTGERTPKPPTGGQKPRLDAAAHGMLRGLVRAQPESTLEELCTRVAATTGIQGSVPTMCRMLQRLGLSRQQSRSTSVSRIRRTANRHTQPHTRLGPVADVSPTI